jgi:hypothetical protein
MGTWGDLEMYGWAWGEGNRREAARLYEGERAPRVWGFGGWLYMGVEISGPPPGPPAIFVSGRAARRAWVAAHARARYTGRAIRAR